MMAEQAQQLCQPNDAGPTMSRAGGYCGDFDSLLNMEFTQLQAWKMRKFCFGTTHSGTTARRQAQLCGSEYTIR